MMDDDECLCGHDRDDHHDGTGACYRCDDCEGEDEL